MSLTVQIAQAMCRTEGKDGQHACPTDFKCSDCAYLPTAAVVLDTVNAHLGTAMEQEFAKRKPVSNALVQLGFLEACDCIRNLLK